jgi:hypothetical protein
MRCLMCGAEMHLAQVVQDDTTMVPGFEHRTLKCLECGEVERRLVFTREKTSAANVPVETTHPVSPTDRRQKERVAKPGAWEQTVARVRIRHAALTRQAAAERAAKAAAARINQRAEEFYRNWDNLIPRRQPSPLPETSTPLHRDEAPAVNLLGAGSERSSKPLVSLRAPPAPPAPSASSRSKAPDEPVAPGSVWARAVAKFRGRRNRNS